MALPDKIETLIVGGGQAGIAMSEHLGKAGRPHIIVEKNRIAERWRSARWDSLCMNGPAWHDRFPGLEFTQDGPDDFPGKDRVAAYFEDYVAMLNAPMHTGIEVISAKRSGASSHFEVQTSAGPLTAQNIVAATGPFQTPIIPPVVPKTAKVTQIHSNTYKNPDQIADGAILVVGAGSSGGQIADELVRAGRDVYLSVGPHQRPPRSYRGRDFCWWLGVLGKWDAVTPGPGTEHVTISVSGAHGGHTVDFRDYAARGLTLVGMTERFEDGTVHFADDLARNIAQGDANYLSLLDEADAYIDRLGLDLPLEPRARDFADMPDCVTTPIRQLDLVKAGINTIIWATGYAVDYSWLETDVFDDAGRPIHQRGVTSEPGVYFLGLPWQSRRGSSFIWGVWHDAKYLADQIVIQRSYLDYHTAASVAD